MSEPLPGTLLGGTVVFGGCSVEEGPLARRVAAADEDPVTLTLDVLRAFLDDTGQDADVIGELHVAGCLTEDDVAVVAEALGRPDLPVSVHAATAEAAMDALLVAAGRTADRPSFVVAVSDGRTGSDQVDPTLGAAATMLVVGAGGNVRFTAEAHLRRHRDRPAAQALLARELLERLPGHDPAGDLVALSAHTPATVRAVFGRNPDRTVATPPVDRLGDLGCAAPYLALAHALAVRDPDQPIVLLHASQTTGLALRIEGGGPESRLELKEVYEAPACAVDRARADRLATAWAGARDAQAQGAFVSRQQYLAQAPARYRTEGQHCRDCGAYVFPPRECCPSCADGDLEPFRFSGDGVVYARTGIGTGGAPTEFVPLQQAGGSYQVAIVELEEGPRAAAMLTGPGAAEATTGSAVHMVTRLLYWQDGMARYGFKAFVQAGPRDDKA